MQPAEDGPGLSRSGGAQRPVGQASILVGRCHGHFPRLHFRKAVGHDLDSSRKPSDRIRGEYLELMIIPSQADSHRIHRFAMAARKLQRHFSNHSHRPLCHVSDFSLALTDSLSLGLSSFLLI